ncbi:MAG: S9 family peptidase [Acidobacteriota bacterium]|nr:S9 family peptidase [Blastocatellia bacterium]MDW8413097.1 S9 family peptidase [Acidobacteriota bacterium]
MSRMLLCLATALLVSSSLAYEKHPVNIDDFLSLKRPVDPQISPDGKWVVFSYLEPVSTTSPRRSSIWLVSTLGGQPRRLTAGAVVESNGRWSPDSRSIAFLSSRGGDGNQIYVIDIDGGEARKLTSMRRSVSSHLWSPDGRYIAFLMTDPLTEEQEARRKAGDDEEIWDGDFKYSGLYTVEVATGKVNRVSATNINVWEYDWAPDSKRFVAVCTDTPRVDEQYVRARLEVLSVEGGEGRLLYKPAGEFHGKLNNARWSPDGSKIAFLASGGGGREAFAGRVWMLDLATGQARNLTEDYLGTFIAIAWLDAKYLACLAIEGVYSSLLKLDAEGRITPLVSPSAGAVMRSAHSCGGGKIAVLKEDSRHPADVWVYADGKFSQLTDLNPQVADWLFGESERIAWQARDGLEIEGVLIKPLDYKPGTRYPLIVNVHGGPEAADLMGFNFGISAFGLMMSARGYAVLMPNYRGSIGRGVKYNLADQGDMGGKEFTDILDGVDYLIARGIADPDRLGIGGWSYGGYMTAWAVTQTNRFKAGMMGAGIANWISFMGLTDIPYENAESHWGHKIFSDPKLYAERSPVEQASKARTPVLIVHGAVDSRVPLSQGQEFYSRLRFEGVTTQLVIYPREGHGLVEPSHQRDYFERLFEWYDRYLR